MSKERPVVGFVVGEIMDEFSEQLCTGIIKAARNDDVDIVVIPVNYIYRDMTGVSDIYEYQYTTSAKYINKDSIDVLIVAGDPIGCYTTRDRLVEFLEQFRDIPMFLVATRIEGYYDISFDNRGGIVDGLRYLMDELKCRKICLFSGPDENSDVRERREVYLEMMRERGLKVEERMIVKGNLSVNCESQAEQILDLNPDAEAIFCVNDNTAICLYDVMEKRGLIPGRDIKIMGYDNTIRGARLEPSLCSVDADPIELGKGAYLLAKKTLKGGNLSSMTLPTTFILRDSFGRFSEKVRYDEETVLDESSINKIFDKVFYRYKNVEEYDDSKLREKFREIMNAAIRCIKSGKWNLGTEEKLVRNIEQFFKLQALSYTDTDEFIDYVEGIRVASRRYFKDIKTSGKINDFIMAVLKNAMHYIKGSYSRTEKEMNSVVNSLKTLVKESMSFRDGNDQSYASIVSGLEWMNIKNAYVYIFDKPVTHLYGENFELPDTVRMKVAMVDGNVKQIPFAEQTISTADIFRNPKMKDAPYNSVLLPIYFEETVYGCVLCDLTKMVHKNGEFMDNQFGAAARVIDLLKINSMIQQQLEENLTVMRKRDVELDRISRNDAAAGILDRRSFMDVAANMIKNNRELGRESIFIYSDMNNLKIINERLGQEEGDRAIREAGRIIAESIGSYGVVGRMGGDEYAALYYGNESIERLNLELIGRFSEYNKFSDKDYNITMSNGFFRISADSLMKLDDIVAEARQDLFVAKENKDTKILK